MIQVRLLVNGEVRPASQSSGASGSAVLDRGDEREPRAAWGQEPLPSADGVGDARGVGSDDDWAHRTAEQRASARGPAPAALVPAPWPAVIKALGSRGKYSSTRSSLSAVDDLKCLWREWEGEAVGGPADALTRDQMDEERLISMNSRLSSEREWPRQGN